VDIARAASPHRLTPAARAFAELDLRASGNALHYLRLPRRLGAHRDRSPGHRQVSERRTGQRAGHTNRKSNSPNHFAGNSLFRSTKTVASPSPAEAPERDWPKPAIAAPSHAREKPMKADENEKGSFRFLLFFGIGAFQRVTADSNPFFPPPSPPPAAPL
jgi:hypothetical protein